ncbi:MAG: hypothetical protein M3Z21_06985, partial [Pseudomonadota bacterium]|nr:hypothetical protein [Pseudomonadota bacterium]
VLAVAFSPNGHTVLTGSLDNTARLWCTDSGEPIGQPMRHDGWVLAVVFSPDGRTVLTCSHDHTVRLWRADTGQPLGQPLRHNGPVQTVAFSPDGRTILTGSDDNTARLWRADSIQPLVQIPELDFDLSDVEPIQGDPRALLAEWERKLALKIDQQTGEVVPYWR